MVYLGFIWWLVGITLVVAFGFLLKNFERWQSLTNDGFAHKWMQLEWWGHSTPNNFLHYQVAGMQNLRALGLTSGPGPSVATRVNEPPDETFTY